ncbi:MAG: PcfB family protein [Oscillospiraceae bacterium]|nr:PcfB family protein [Oscillospiraceae bacterium]
MCRYIENKLVVLIENCTKLTARELRQALEKVLASAGQGKQHQTQKAAEPHGRMTVKELAAKDKGMQSIEVNDGSIGAFQRVARKYGIDFAPFKVKGENRYLVFFKAPDADAMTAAFTEYTQKQVKSASRPSILQRLEHFKSMIRPPKKEKTRHKEPER